MLTDMKPSRRRHRVETVPDLEPEMASLEAPVMYSPIGDPLTEDSAVLGVGSKTLKVKLR